MCGRLACILSPENLCKACSYKNKSKNDDSKYIEPKFKEDTFFKYSACYNLYPSEVVPVLIYKDHVDNIDSEAEFVIVPMHWGLPTPDYIGAKLSLHNARLDNLNRSNLFKPELTKNHRCAILCNGYFEWQTKGKEKQPFFITQKENGDIKEWGGEPIVKMAGIFSKQTDFEGTEKYYCSVITTEADKSLSWLHHRMPIVLKSFNDIENWINYKKVDSHKGIDFLVSYGNMEDVENKNTTYIIDYHAVNKKFVNNPKCKSEECITPITFKRQMTLDNFFNKKGPAASSSNKN